MNFILYWAAGSFTIDEAGGKRKQDLIIVAGARAIFSRKSIILRLIERMNFNNR